MMCEWMINDMEDLVITRIREQARVTKKASKIREMKKTAKAYVTKVCKKKDIACIQANKM
jgi:hypothetical protein